MTRALGLTRRQHQLLTFIRGFIAEHGHSPTFDDMARHLGVKSRGNVHDLVTRLAERGYVVRSAGRRQAIALVDRAGAFELVLPREVEAAVRDSAARAGVAPIDVIQRIIRRATLGYTGAAETSQEA